MKFAHHQVCKRPQEATAAATTTSSDDDLHELEKLIKCSSHISSEDAAEARRLANNVERQRREWQLYVVVCLGLCVGGLLLVYAAASNSLLLVSTKPRHHHLASEDQNGPGHAHSSSAPNYYSIQPDGVNNVIECALREREGEGGRTLFIVINSRAQNFERRRKLRASWLNAPNLRRELCHRRRPRELGRPSSSGSAAGAPPAEPNADASINQSNRALAHKARINRIEWLFALGHVRADQDLTSSGEHKEVAILGRERGQFNDLLMLPLVDSYRNMTLKHLAIFEWLLGRQQNQGKSIGRSQSDQAATSSIRTTTTTTTTPLLIKADDDAQLDLAQMISKYVIETTGHAPTVRNPRPLLMCARFEAGTSVTRYHPDGTGSGNKTNSNQMNENKWALTRSEWPEDTFPAYCSGLAYLATLDLIEALKKAAARNRRAPLWIDDVYLTGVLLGRLPRNSHRIIKLNSYYCYTRAQKLHRESLEPGLRCMAYEDREA